MKTRLTFEIQGKKVEVKATAVYCEDLVIRQQFVELLVACRANCGLNQDPVLRLLNEHVSFLDVKNLRLIEEAEEKYIIPAYILEEEMMLENQAA